MSRYVPTGSSAAGGIGSVHFCQDQNLDRKVAVKFIHRGGEHRRLLDELAALQRIRSKHVVEIFDIAYLNPGPQMGIVEEFVDGDDLRPLLGTLKPDEHFVRLLYQMAAGLSDIHAVGIVHRDIKPSNMLIDKEGILKIIDFNLARPMDEAHTQGFVGTRGYAAPELYGGGKIDFDEKIDVYALAVTAYALLCGATLPAELLGHPPPSDAWKTAGGGFNGLGTSLDPEIVRLLDASLCEDPALRPTAVEVRLRAARLLLRGRHRALFTSEAGTTFELHAGKPKVTLQHPSSLGTVTIGYDHLDFRVITVAGEVWVNNMQLAAGALLPDCCVIGLGGPHRRASERVFMTMDLSHPEVVL